MFSDKVCIKHCDVHCFLDRVGSDGKICVLCPGSVSDSLALVTRVRFLRWCHQLAHRNRKRKRHLSPITLIVCDDGVGGHMVNRLSVAGATFMMLDVPAGCASAQAACIRGRGLPVPTMFALPAGRDPLWPASLFPFAWFCACLAALAVLASLPGLRALGFNGGCQN